MAAYIMPYTNHNAAEPTKCDFFDGIKPFFCEFILDAINYVLTIELNDATKTVRELSEPGL